MKLKLTSVLPHALLHEPIVRETLLADERVTARGGACAELILT